MCCKQDIPYAPSKIFLMLLTGHFLCFDHQQCTCHFLVNSADCPRIWANHNQIRANPGTIGRIRQKMACEIFELRTARKSRGWLRFGRFLHKNRSRRPDFVFSGKCRDVKQICASTERLRRRNGVHNKRRTSSKMECPISDGRPTPHLNVHRAYSGLSSKPLKGGDIQGRVQVASKLRPS